MSGVGEFQTRNGFIAGGTGHGAPQLGAHRGRRHAGPPHPARLGARPPAGCRAEPDLIVAVAAQEPRSAELAQQPLPGCARGSHQRREMLRVGAAAERRGRETRGPERDPRQRAPRNIERPPEREQLTPEAEQQPHRGQGLDQLRRDVSHIAKARAADARFLGVGEQHAPALASQSAGDRAADDARADHRDPVLLPHASSVYDLQRSIRLTTPLKCSWSGVFPAATTQFGTDLAVDLQATCAVLSALVRDGVHGLVLLGTVGENNSLTAEEKRAVLTAAVGAVGGKVPLIAGVSALNESAPDPRRFTDVLNALGDRYVLFAGLDDFAFEGLVLGARGWVSGLTNAFPVESLALCEAIRNGQLERARTIYRWFMPLLHLDSEPDLVQSIKLAEAIMGRGSERVRPPRLPLAGERRAAVMERVERARAARPA